MDRPDRASECDRAAGQLFGCRDADETAALRAHLDACPHCRQAWAWDVRLGDRLRGLPSPTPPTGLAAKVRHRVRRRRLRRVGLGAASAVVLLAGTIATLPRPRPVAPPSASAPNESPESALVIPLPPVDPLDRLARQQDGYAAVIQQMWED
jgi:anti-sigma factor RsiW